jgi:hypothetical protein
MRIFLLSFIVGFVFAAQAQIVNDKIKRQYPTQFYFETSRSSVFRTLQENTDFLTIPLGERANEIPLNLWSQQMGVCLGFSKHSLIDAGLAWMQNGEAYSWETLDTDSSFSYQTRYRYLALPVQFKLAFGEKITFSAGAGLIPALYQSYRQDQQWTNALGAKYDDQVKVNNGMNSFTLSWVSSVHLEIPMNPTLRLRLGVQYRRQLNNSYDPYQDYIHKSAAWGLNLGLAKKI